MGLVVVSALVVVPSSPNASATNTSTEANDLLVEIPGGGRFFDDDTSIFQADIEAIATDGITKGCNPPFQTGYCPDDFVTRGQMAAFLVRAMGYTDNGGGDIFDDDDGTTFENDIDRLATAGVTKGCNPPANNNYCPDDFVTRGQMAAFLVRAMGYTDNGGGDIFDDDDGTTFENDIDRLATAGVTKGCNPPANNNYCPDDFVTRGQMAAFLARALELPKLPVPDRPETTNGYHLDVIGLADMKGCPGDDGEICTVPDNTEGEFFLLTGWFEENWSSLPSSEKADFQSDRVRLEATLDGVDIELVDYGVEVINDQAFKTYTFQFPSWLGGNHVLDVKYIDDSESYIWTIRVNLTTAGDGYPVGIAATATTHSQEEEPAAGYFDTVNYLSG